MLQFSLFLIIIINYVSSETVSLKILQTNDIRGNLYTNSTHKGLLFVGELVNQIRSTLNESSFSLLVDAGNACFPGGRISEMFGCESVVDVMNSIGYNISTVGESEFAHGVQTFSDIAQKSEFKWLSANTVDNAMPQLWHKPASVDILPYRIFSFGSGSTLVRVGVLGVTIPHSMDLNQIGVHLQPPIQTIKRYAPIISSECDVWFLILSGGMDTVNYVETTHNIAIAVANAGITLPLIIGATATDRVSSDNTVYIVPGTTTVVVSNPPFAAAVGELDLEIDVGKKQIKLKKYSLHETKTVEFSDKIKKTEVSKRVFFWEEELKKKTSYSFGKSHLLLIKKPYESALSLLVADFFLNNLKTKQKKVDSVLFDDSFLKEDLIYTSFLPADVTYNKLFRLFPEKFSLFVFETKGEKILQLLSQSAQFNVPLHVSGITYEWWNDMNGNTGLRKIRIGGKVLEKNKSYIISIPSTTSQLDTSRMTLKETITEDFIDSFGDYIQNAHHGYIIPQNIPMSRTRRIFPPISL